MDYGKLDAALQELLTESDFDETPVDTVLVSIVVAADSDKADLDRLGLVVPGNHGGGFGVTIAELTPQELSAVSENPAVRAVQLSRRLRPRARRHA
jgi:hypothetical protein